jgi:hypothetical protein
MTADAVTRTCPRPAGRRTGRATARLLRLELRHNVMLWMLPVAIALFFTTYRKALAMPPLWNLRAATLQLGAITDFITPVVGAAAWTATRDARCHLADLTAISARPRWARLLAAWAATAGWALGGYLACLAVLYGVTAHQASWGGPLWWPAAVAAAAMPALTALGFAAGTLLPSRFTAPAAAIAVFFAVVLTTEPIVGSQSYWAVSPLITGPWDVGPDPGAGTFYARLPDLPIAQVMFLAGLTVAVLAALALPRGSGGRSLRAAAAVLTAAGLLAAGTAVTLAGTGRMNDHGMIVIPALHDAAADRPARYAPACSPAAIPVCLNPAYARFRPATVAALRPVLRELAGLPGAPARISQAAATYRQGAGNSVSVGLRGPFLRGRPPVFRLVLPGQLPGPPLSTSELASEVRSVAGPDIIASVTADGPAASPAQHAVTAALILAAGGRVSAGPPGRTPAASRARAGGRPPASSRAAAPSRAPTAGRGRTGGRTQLPPWSTAPGSPVFAAAQRFAALPAAARHAWLVQHLTALRAGQVTLAQLP